eukprot:14912309-Ditylum_brightwellii.AAC.1
MNSRYQVYIALLQTCANVTKVGYIFYLIPTVNLNPLIQRVSVIIKEEEGIILEIAVKNKAAFELTNDWIKWYSKHNMKGDGDKEKLNLHKVPTIYCNTKYASVLDLYLSSAFAKFPNPKYMTGQLRRRFVPAPPKLGTLIHSVVSLPGFNLDTFFEPISNNKDSPFFISPYAIATKMPRSGKDINPAFFQFGTTRKESTVQGMCIPSLANRAATYGKIAVQYVSKYLKNMRANDLLPRIITKEAAAEIQ